MALCVETNNRGALIGNSTPISECNTYVLVDFVEYQSLSNPETEQFDFSIQLFIVFAVFLAFVHGYSTGDQRD